MPLSTKQFLDRPIGANHDSIGLKHIRPIAYPAHEESLPDIGMGQSGPSDADLIARVELADESAFCELYDRHCRVVFSIALRICQEVQAAEDVVQEVFMQIWRAPQQFKKITGSSLGWLSVTSRNRSIDWLRRRRPGCSIEDVCLSGPCDLARVVETNLMMVRVRASVALLSKEQRRLLEMAFFDGKSHGEIAAETGCPLGTVKTRIRSALKLLRAASGLVVSRSSGTRH